MAGSVPFRPDTNIGPIAKQIMEMSIEDDADMVRMCILMRDLANGCAAVIDVGADEIYDALYQYDKGKRMLNARRPRQITAPIRHYASMVRFAHRFMFKVIRLYRKLYADDIANQNAAKRKNKFTPGRKAS